MDTRKREPVAPPAKKSAELDLSRHNGLIAALVREVVASDIRTPFAIRFVGSGDVYFLVREGREGADTEALHRSILEQWGEPLTVIIGEREVGDLSVGEDGPPFRIVGVVGGEVTP